MLAEKNALYRCLDKLLPHMRACTDPDFELEFKTMTPSVTTVHALSEFRFSRAVIRGAIEAEQKGYDVFFMNHFQDVGLYEARAAVKITRSQSVKLLFSIARRMSPCRGKFSSLALSSGCFAGAFASRFLSASSFLSRIACSANS